MKRVLYTGLISMAVLWLGVSAGDAQLRKVRVAMPGYTIAGLSFLTAKINGYYANEGLDVELIAMRAPTANLAVLSASVDFSTVPLAGLTTALRGGALKLLMVHFDKPQHSLFAKNELQNVRALRGKKIAVAGPAAIDDLLLREYLAANGVDAGRELNILSIGAADTRATSLISGTVDAAMLIAPFTFVARGAGYREMVAFKDQGFLLPSGGIITRDEFTRAEPGLIERFVRASMMGFIHSRDNRGAAIKVLTKSLKIDEQIATKVYDESRPTMTADGTLPDDAQKKMAAFIAKTSGLKEIPPLERVFDFSFVRKANAMLDAKGWHPGS
ncbi:MAG TPA: ABC transporter substrate-binding protein [Acidobacteriota bacterium]|nr:ABC transporter substrate-binding protein [Acidobacteriota bacterium]